MAEAGAFKSPSISSIKFDWFSENALWHSRPVKVQPTLIIIGESLHVRITSNIVFDAACSKSKYCLIEEKLNQTFANCWQKL